MPCAWGVGAPCASTRCRATSGFARNRSARMYARSRSTRWAAMRSASSGATGTRPASTRSSFCASCVPARSAQRKAKHEHDRSPRNRRYILRLATEARSGHAYGDSASRPCGTLQGARNAASAACMFAANASCSRSRAGTGPPLRSGEDPVGELGRAAGAHEVDRPMEVDVDPAREFPRRLLVVACPPKRGPAPSDHLALLAVKLSLCDRHRAPTSLSESAPRSRCGTRSGRSSQPG